MSNYSTISIDTATKNRASKRAKKERMNISFITRLLLNDYADGKITIGSQMAVTENGFTPAFEKAMLRDTAELEAEIEAGTTKSYDSAEEMMEDILRDPDV